VVRPVGIPRENFALVFGPPIPDKEKKEKKKEWPSRRLRQSYNHGRIGAVGKRSS
jgi:hypothetical protein